MSIVAERGERTEVRAERVEEQQAENGERRGGYQNVWLSWQQTGLENMVELYPEDLREPVVWLGAYVRDECGRSFDVLCSRAQKLGIELDRTTWSKVLRGRWQADSYGNPLPTPIVSQTKLLRAIAALRHDARLRSQEGKVPFIETSVAQTIMHYIESKMAVNRVNKFGLIVGETGSSRTSTFKELVARSPYGQMMWLEAPENGALTELISHLAWRYGVSLSCGNVQKRNKVFMATNDRRCIIVDNAQDLYNERRGHNQPAFGFLRRLQDETGCTIILSLTPTGERLLFEQFLKGYFEQFEGRTGGRRKFLRLPAYPPEEDILKIAMAFGLRDAERHLECLSKIAHEPGRIRTLFEDLQSAKIKAEREKKQLTIGHVKACREED